jgi:multidrug efflux pump subunit AcrA (membrane-fusion protein)
MNRAREPRPRGAWKAATILTLVLLAAGCVPSRPTTGAPQAQDGRAGANGVPVSTQVVQLGPIASRLNYAGNVQAEYSVQVMPKATGRIVQLAADVGSAVRAGDLLARLDAGQLQASVQQAEGSLRAAEASWHRRWPRAAPRTWPAPNRSSPLPSRSCS